MDYIYQLINLFKRWSSYFGLTNRQNFEDKFYQLLHDKHYDEALRLAQQYDYLDIDLVYKCRWRNSGITVQSIDTVLGKIQDKLWIINECVQTVPISFVACKRLIEFGLEEASLRLLYELSNESSPNYSNWNKKYDKPGAKRDKKKEKQPLLKEDTSDEVSSDEEIELVNFNRLNEQQRELCRCRQNLLRFEHSLFAYESILGDKRSIQQNFDHVFYDELREKSALNLCIDYAHEGNAHAVEVCLKFYTDDLKSHLLPILSNFPETLSPYQYRNLLPCLRDNEEVYEWRCVSGQIRMDYSDWCYRDRNASVLDTLKKKSKTYEREFYEENTQLKKYLKPLTSDLLTEWFIERALEIESRTLLTSGATQLLHLGSELNIKNLKQLNDDLLEFCRIVYDCCTETNLYLSFADFNNLPEIERLILKVSSPLDIKDPQTNEAKYRALAFALTHCDDPDGGLSVKILNYIIDLRKRDVNIQMAYIQKFID